jgi:hypothetical protein
MIGLHRILGAALCCVLFCVCLGLSDVASSAENKKSESEKVIIGNVLRIEGNNYVVKDREDGKEIRLQVDKTTQMNVVGVTVGDDVMAKVDDQNHAELIITDLENQFR